MRKVLAAVIVLALCMAGTALARTNESKNNPQMNRPVQMTQNAREFPARGPRWQNVSGDFRGPRENFRPGSEGRHRGYGFGEGQRFGTFTPDMPKEIREKAAELAKLRIDLEEAMTSRPLNKQKALDIYAKIQKVKQEIQTWRFTQSLERIEARQKKGLPPAPEDMNTAQEEETQTPENAAQENESAE